MTTKRGVTINIAGLTAFIATATPEGYATDAEGVLGPFLIGFTQLEYPPNESGTFVMFNYEDHYTGFFQAPGMEIVYSDTEYPIWSRAYYGGMEPEFQEDEKFAEETFVFLRWALCNFDPRYPFRRGPEEFKDGEWEYHSHVTGDIKRFDGEEWIFYQGQKVFWQRYGGGLILEKGTQVVEG